MSGFIAAKPESALGRRLKIRSADTVFVDLSKVDRLTELVGDLVHIAPEDWRQIGIDNGGVAAPDELHERADLVGDRNLREPHLPRHVGDGRLVMRSQDTIEPPARNRSGRWRQRRCRRASRPARHCSTRSRGDRPVVPEAGVGARAALGI